MDLIMLKINPEPTSHREAQMDELQWIVQKRGNTRSCQYNMCDMRGALERAGCTVEGCPPGYWLGVPTIIAKTLFLVKRPLTQDEDPRAVRQDVTRSAKLVHPRALIRFIGLNGEYRNDRATF